MKTEYTKMVGIFCVGFAETKALSKVANKIAKKFQDRARRFCDSEKQIKA
jgi:DNA polymerase V